MKRERRFPIQGDQYREAGWVPWSLAELAYQNYRKAYGNSQTLERLAERHGFGWEELTNLLLNTVRKGDEWVPLKPEQMQEANR